MMTSAQGWSLVDAPNSSSNPICFAEDISRDIVKRKNVSLEAPAATENLLSLILERGYLESKQLPSMCCQCFLPWWCLADKLLLNLLVIFVSRRILAALFRPPYVLTKCIPAWFHRAQGVLWPSGVVLYENMSLGGVGKSQGETQPILSESLELRSLTQLVARQPWCLPRRLEGNDTDMWPFAKIFEISKMPLYHGHHILGWKSLGAEYSADSHCWSLRELRWYLTQKLRWYQKRLSCGKKLHVRCRHSSQVVVSGNPRWWFEGLKKMYWRNFHPNAGGWKTPTVHSKGLVWLLKWGHNADLKCMLTVEVSHYSLLIQQSGEAARHPGHGEAGQRKDETNCWFHEGVPGLWLQTQIHL